MSNLHGVLLIEADNATAEAVSCALGELGRDIRLLRVASAVAFVERLDEIEPEPDLVIADPGLESDSALSICELAKRFWPGASVVYISEVDGEEAAAEAMSLGVADYLYRGRLDRLGTALERALREAAVNKRANEATELRRVYDERYRYFLEQTTDGFYRLDFDPPIPVDLPEDELIARMYESGRIVECNRVYAETYGMGADEMIGTRLVDLHGGADVAQNLASLRRFVRAGLRHIGVETVEIGVDGAPVYLSNNSVGIVEKGFYVSCWGMQRDITEQRRAEDLLKESREQLRALLARLRRAQEDERTQAARDIHDELGQLLTGLKMDLRWLEERLSEADIPVGLNPLLDRAVGASELVDQTIGAVQRIAADLRPSALDRLGLVAALEARARRFSEQTGVSISMSMPEPPPEIPPQVADEVFYIGQEALTNIARHAHAKNVVISLSEQGRELWLEISDDGIGITSSELGAPRSLGVMGMKERALGCGGKLDVDALEPHGTRVRVRVPLGHESEAERGVA